MASRTQQIETDPVRQLYARLNALEAEVRELRAGRRLEAASIGAGGLTIKGGGALRVIDADGNAIGRIGDLGDGKRGFILQRAGGYRALEVYGTGEGTDYGFVGVYDVLGNYIITDDAASQRGLARPYLHLMVGEISVPTATTNSSTFGDLATGAVSVQQPVMYAYLLVRASDATTAGEVRLALDGTGIGPVLPVPAGAYNLATIGPFAVPAPGAYGSLRFLSVQARRTAGTGTVGVRVLSILGLESAYA